MIKKLITCLVLCGLMAAPALAQSDVRADRYGAIVVEAQSGKILYAEHADRILHPASLTKLMTLYMTFAALRAGQINENTELQVSSYAANAPPTKLNLQPGDTIRVRDAVLGLITRSANDAARVLAEGIGGNETRFADMMTREARRLGMKNTTFKNASGLPNPGQISTPKDMAMLARAIIAHFPEYYGLFSTQEFTYRGVNYANHNHLMERYPGMDGMKTGYVAASGFNLVSSAVQGGTRLIGVVFGGRSAAARDDYMAGLLDKGFMDARNYNAHGASRYAGTVMQPGKTQNMDPTPQATVQQVAMNTPTQTGAVDTAANQGDTDDEDAAAPVADNQTPSVATTTADKADEAAAKVADNGNGNWGVQIGAYKSKREASKALRHAQKNYKNLHKASALITTIKTKGGVKMYRARLVGITKSAAAGACNSLQSRGKTCVAVKANG